MLVCQICQKILKRGPFVFFFCSFACKCMPLNQKKKKTKTALSAWKTLFLPLEMSLSFYLH